MYVLRFVNNLKAKIKKDVDDIMCGRTAVQKIKAVELCGCLIHRRVSEVWRVLRR